MSDFLKNCNFLLETNGASIYEVTSEKKGCCASNLLNSNERTLWLSDPGLPQELIINISSLSERPEFFSCFGWYCWQPYNSNPSQVELWASSNLHNWEKWGQFQGSMKGGVLYFMIPPLGLEYSYIKVVVRDTFGAANTYINQLYLLEENPNKTIQFEEEHSSPVFNYYEDDDLKGKLKIQLDELQEEVRSICSEKIDSPKSVPSHFTSPISKVFSPFQKVPKKPENGLKLKKEVEKWSGCIREMQKNIEKIAGQVGELEKNVMNRDYADELMEFKEEIIREIKQIDFASSTREKEEAFSGNLNVMLEEYMRTWEERVYKPQITEIWRKVERKEGGKEDPQAIVKKLKEKIALKAELEKKKRKVIGIDIEENRIRSRDSPKRYY